MPLGDLERADRAIRRAAELLGRKLSPRYPGPSPHERAHRARRQVTRSVFPDKIAAGELEGPDEPLSSIVIEELVGLEAAELLEAAADLERRAGEAIGAAVEANRQAGRKVLSWPDVGAKLGISGQAAHKRYRGRAEGPEAQGRLEDLEEPAA